VCAGDVMRYDYAPDLKERLKIVVQILNMAHIDLNRVECLRSFGSSTKRILARCHTIGKVMQKGMRIPAFYTIEFLEKFDKLSIIEQDKVLIHELLHIPKTFGGGFRQHDYVCEDTVDKLHRNFTLLRR